MNQKWDDEKEKALVLLLHDLLTPTTLSHIERASDATNIQWSSLVTVALTLTHWDRLEMAVKEADVEQAMAEVEDILREEP